MIPAVGDDVREMEWRHNPAIVCGGAALHVARLALRSRGGMAPGPMPDAGGLNDQAAWLIAAIGHVLSVDAEWREQDGKRRGE